ncbi:MAG: nitrous oxide reductase accessory protein NosL [Nitrospirota bacterium]|jgi:nitrous oxide reductase accessory protein NosL
MKKKSILMLTLLSTIALALLAGAAFSDPMDIPAGSRCRSCGMKVDPASVYSAQIVTGGEMLPFCDIGDMLSFYKKQKEKPSELYVRDSKSGRWIDAMKAVYVKSEKFNTPMGWGIAAFARRDEAAGFGKPMTFEETLKVLGAMMKGKM